MEGHKDSSKDQSTALESPISLVEGYSRDGLTLTTLLASTGKESDTDKSPDIDVIHVMVVAKEEERLTLESLLLDSVASRRRELVFRCGMGRLLAGELTSQAIDGLARQLLSNLLFFLKHDEQHSKRALVFVAYDFGDLIVKKAISIAGANEQRWPGIFTSAAQFLLDSSTAILGVSNEITFQEQKQKDKKPFPDLPKTICSSIKSWVPHESWIPFGQTLLTVTSAPRLLSSTCLVDSHPVFKSTEHERWMTSTGARVLYVRGNDYNGVMEAAEQVFFHWKLKMRQHWSDGVFLPISFVFSAHDPTRCSIKDVISSLLVSYFSGIAIEKNGPNPGLMKDQFLLQHAWTEMDLFKIVKLFARTVIGEKALLLLQNIDECDKGSRDAFWAMLSDFATTSEVRFKVAVTLASTPADVLGNALRDIADQDGLCWILKWLFMGRRPLSYRELAMVLCHCKRGEARSFQTPSRADVEDSLSKLRVWLRGIAESSSGRVRVREDVRGYLQNELSYIWAESTSPDAITTFLLDYLTAPDIQRRLDSMNKRYQSRVQSSGKAITPPLISDGQDIIFYAIQALPYHLSEDPDILKSIRDELMADDSKLTAWSKAFWAMSNPFSRPESGMLNSPYETLLALGELKSESVAILKEMNASAKSPDIDSLSSAIREGNEDVALDGTPQFFPSPLYMAARLCHAQIMDMLIERGANIHVKRYGKYKAIQTAASHSNIHGVKSLPETPLYFAALEGCWHMARSLLELGADPNSGVGERPNERWAPLVVAAEANHIKTARILLENGADPNICGPNDLDTPLWFAATKAASVDMVQLLLDKGADPNHELLQPPLVMELMEASLSAESKLAILEVLVRHSSPIRVNVANGKHMTPLLLAAEAGELSIVTWLLEHEADVNAVDKRSRSALHCAMKNGHVEVVRELLKWKPQLNNLTTNGQPLVELAVQDVAMMQMLLDAGADIELANAKDHTALNIAVDLKKPAVVKLLVERKADMHHVGKNGWNAITIATSNPAGPEIIRVLTSNTPLHYVTSHSAQLARILLEFRTSLDLEQRNNELKTPLLNACTAKNAECVKLLIRAGADVNAEDRLGWTPLSLSARVSLAADAIDAISKVKGTALMVACRSLNLEMVAKLLAHGADANISVKGISYDNTALKCACIPWSSTYSENKDNVAGIIGELIAHGADVNAMSGFTIYNAICAASFSADASIINLLLDKGASAQDPDPLGRLPIHFAAANGIKNFDAMAFAHRGDLLVCDRAGKNALHWAAQLLDSSSRYNKEYIDQPDIDGWTPLCWATRGMQTRLGPDSESEPRDYIQTFTIGTGGKVETFTPVQMARLCGAQGEIIDMLETNPDGSLTNATAGRSRGAKKQSKKYKSKTAFCDICLHTIFGYSYQCQTCLDFDACKKCYSRIHLYHNLDGDEQHSFAFREGYDQEFEDLPTPDSPVSDVEIQEDPVAREAEHFNDGDGDGDGDDVVDELQNEVQNEADDLALGGLDDLDELEVAEDDPATPP
ncbi:ankyrin repeat-containing domain protein [Trichoderma asperelloides]|nr:ankyrin repeat-containing domain protein [Trichoderma asperelloides]